MTVQIEHLEQVRDNAGPSAPVGRGAGASRSSGSSAAQEAEVLAVIRREQSRRGRLWAD